MLGRMIAGAQFGEHHMRLIPAEPDVVWEAIIALRWSDLTVTRPLMLLRGFGPRGLDRSILDGTGPVSPSYVDRPRELVATAIERPWKLRPEPGPSIPDPAAFAAFDEPGWLKQGMDFVLTSVPGGTRVDTSTLCRATDAGARRRFRLYWLLIRPFSGLIRRDILSAIARSATRRQPTATRGQPTH